MNKNAVELAQTTIIIAIIVIITVAVVINYGGNITNLFKSASQTQFDDVCCCKGADCSKILKQDCDLRAKFGYRIEKDTKKCE